MLLLILLSDARAFKMGGMLEKPKTEKHSEQGSGNGLRFGLSAMQGWRIEMEDAHTALVRLQGELKVNLAIEMYYK